MSANRGSLPHPLSPVARPTVPMRHGKDIDLLLKAAVHNAEGELVEDVAAAAGEVDWPALGSFRDDRHGLLKLAFEIQRGSKTSFFIPRE